MSAADINRAILAVWRIEQPRLITSLARILRDVPLAEDLTQEALLAALERWPSTGVPEKPGAWLMATAKHRALDHLRRGRMLERKHEMIARDMEEGPEAALAIVDRLAHEPALKGYHLLPSVRGDLLHKLGRYEEARAAFEAAAALAGNTREHDLLRRRAAEAADAAKSPTKS